MITQNLLEVFSNWDLKRWILAENNIYLLGNHVVYFFQFSDGDVELVKLRSGCFA